MGTNYYLMKYNNKYAKHIGKTSAAGKYCFECNQSLLFCEGALKPELGNPHAGYYESLKVCPTCLKEPKWAAASFSWAMKPDRYALLKDNVKIHDEYGRRLTKRQMTRRILNARWHFYDSIGREFS